MPDGGRAEATASPARSADAGGRAAGARRPTWGIRACAALAVLAFAPEWTLEPLATFGPEARVLAPLSGIAALVLLVAVVTSLGGPDRGSDSEAPSGPSARADDRPKPAVRPLLGAAPGAVFWIELVEITLALALLASVLGGAATSIAGLENTGLAAAVAAIILATAVALWIRPLPGVISATLSVTAVLLLVLLVGTAARNFMSWRAVPVAPPPFPTIPRMWAEVPFATVLKSFGLAGAMVAGISVFARTGGRRGMGRLAAVEGLFFLLIVLLFISYAQRVGTEEPTIFPAIREVFGGGTGAAAVQAAVIWMVLGAMILMLERWRTPEHRRRGLMVAGAAVVMTLLVGADPGILAALWVLAALAWMVPTHARLFLGRATGSGTPPGAGSRWRAIADGLATLGTAIAAIGALLFLAGCVRPVPEKRLDEVRLPPGFSIDIYVDGIEQARQMTLGEDGTLYVGTKTLGSLYAVPDRNGDYRGDEVIVLATGLENANGVAVRGDTLYVSENHRITRWPDISQRLEDPPEPEIVTTLPRRSYHKEAYMRLGPDGALYVAIGAPCNVCLPQHPLFGTLSRLPPVPDAPETDDGDEVLIEIMGSGIRNTVGFDWHPRTGRLWFADNARDWLANDAPPDEINVISEPGQDFGFPYCHGRAIRDPEFGDNVNCARFVPPVLELESHVAALGIKFYDGSMFPEAYRDALLVAEHGSYNRSDRVGYRITMATGLEGGSPELTVFADGFLTADDQVWGRPVDLLVMPDGSLLVSDDFNNAIYRITYDPTAAP